MPDYKAAARPGRSRRSPAAARSTSGAGRRPVLPRPAGLRPALRRRPVRDRAGHAGRRTTSTPWRCRCRRPRWPLRATPARNPVIGVWSTTERRLDAALTGHGDPDRRPRCRSRAWATRWSTRSSLPAGLKDAFNALTPNKDATIPGSSPACCDPEVPKLVEAIYGIPAPAGPRNDLVEIFLTGIAKARRRSTARRHRSRPT